MNIGDRVRLLRSTEEGIVRKISSSGRIEVEIEDGFTIPALKSEAVVIHSAEEAYFGKKEEGIQEEKTPLPISKPKDQGLYLAFIPINDQNISLYLINESRDGYLVHCSEVFGTNHRTLFADKLLSGESKKFDDRILKQLDEWPAFLLRFFPIQTQLGPEKKPFERKFKIKASQFFKHLGEAPLLGKRGYLFHLEQTTQDLDVQKLNLELENIKPKPITEPIKKPAQRIDLHIEELVPNPVGMSNSEMLRIQLETFEKKLNQAIASGMHEITFVHGIGNGVLRKEIQKRLSELRNIQYFKDTQKDKWGYGATLVRIS